MRAGRLLTLSAGIPLSVVLQVVQGVMFGEMGLHGNHLDYYNPKNSSLFSLLREKKGIPITLSILYISVAQALGIPAEGLNTPMHFLIRIRVGSPAEWVYVDAFSQGKASAGLCAAAHPRSCCPRAT